jgi:hypothetical protein
MITPQMLNSTLTYTPSTQPNEYPFFSSGSERKLNPSSVYLQKATL